MILPTISLYTILFNKLLFKSAVFDSLIWPIVSPVRKYLILNVILNNIFYQNNPISEHLPVSNVKEYGFCNKMHH